MQKCAYISRVLPAMAYVADSATGSVRGRVSHQTYSGDRIFSGDSLTYSYFPGGYFDGKGGVYYTHADYLGSITMVTDATGNLVQHTGYYPYGEPWREPSGQPRLYGGKERERFMALNDYDFHARRLNSATTLWNAPDPLAGNYTNLSPYVYCAANPIMYADPTGMDWVETLDGSVIWEDNITEENYKYSLKDGDIYRGPSYTRYIDIGEQLVQEQYKPDKTVQREVHDGTYQLDFKGFLVTSYAVTNKNLNLNNNAEFGIIGDVYVNAVFSNGDTYTVSQYDFSSGPYGNGPLPNHNYTAFDFTSTSERGMMIYGKAGWKVFLDDFNGRDGLRIHPDTNIPGTSGCIGIHGTANDLKELGSFFKKVIKTNKRKIKVKFQIPDNPNYNDNGKANPFIGQ